MHGTNLSARNSTFMFIFAVWVPGGVAQNLTYVIDIVHAACNKEKGSAESWTRKTGFDRASESLELCIERR